MNGSFSDLLRCAREARGLTQEELAEVAGISRGMVAKYEVKMGKPSIEVLVKLSKALGVTTDNLLGIEKPDEHLHISVVNGEPVATVTTNKNAPTQEQRKDADAAEKYVRETQPSIIVPEDLVRRIVDERIKELFNGRIPPRIDVE